jgi:hypothetical protein
MLQQTGRLALALLGLGVLAAATPGGNQKTNPTRVTARAEKPGPDGTQKITVVVESPPGWYVYANPVGLKEFKDNATVIKVTGNAKVEEVKVAYPPGKVKEDKILGNYNIYEGKVEIPLTVRRARGDTGPLELSVLHNTCHHKGECLQPKQVTIKLP